MEHEALNEEETNLGPIDKVGVGHSLSAQASHRRERVWYLEVAVQHRPVRDRAIGFLDR